MGYGDEVMASGLARRVMGTGRRAAFGDGNAIIWGPWCEEVFRHNHYIAHPGEHTCKDLVWIPHYKGHRLYNKLTEDRARWIWNYDFKPVPGMLFFNAAEYSRAEQIRRGFVLVEPNVPWHKSVAPNKDWGFKNYQEVVNRLLKDGRDVVQLSHGRDRLLGVRVIQVSSYRDALLVLERADAALVPEGGLHHGAAAVGTRAVVLFGGFIPPQVTGYDAHVNLTGNSSEACGSINPCVHCRRAMLSISVDEVYAHLTSASVETARTA